MAEHTAAGMCKPARDKIQRRLDRVRAVFLPDDGTLDPQWVEKMIERTARQLGASEFDTKQATQDLVRLLSRDIPALLVAARFCERTHVENDARDGRAYEIVRDALARHAGGEYGDLALNAERAAAIAITVLAATGYIPAPEKITGESCQSA